MPSISNTPKITDLGWKICYVKLSIAVAIIRKKPNNMSLLSYCQNLCSSFRTKSLKERHSLSSTLVEIFSLKQQLVETFVNTEQKKTVGRKRRNPEVDKSTNVNSLNYNEVSTLLNNCNISHESLVRNNDEISLIIDNKQIYLDKKMQNNENKDFIQGLLFLKTFLTNPVLENSFYLNNLFLLSPSLNYVPCLLNNFKHHNKLIQVVESLLENMFNSIHINLPLISLENFIKLTELIAKLFNPTYSEISCSAEIHEIRKNDLMEVKEVVLRYLQNYIIALINCDFFPMHEPISKGKVFLTEFFQRVSNIRIPMIMLLVEISIKFIHNIGAALNLFSKSSVDNNFKISTSDQNIRISTASNIRCFNNDSVLNLNDSSMQKSNNFTSERLLDKIFPKVKCTPLTNNNNLHISNGVLPVVSSSENYFNYNYLLNGCNFKNNQCYSRTLCSITSRQPLFNSIYQLENIAFLIDLIQDLYKMEKLNSSISSMEYGNHQAYCKLLPQLKSFLDSLLNELVYTFPLIAVSLFDIRKNIEETLKTL